MLQATAVHAIALVQPSLDQLSIDVAGEIGNWHQRRRVTHDPVRAIDQVGEPRLRLEAVLALGLGDGALEALDVVAADLAPPAVEDPLCVEPGVPDVEVRHRRELGHRLSVRARNPSDDRARRLRRELPRPGRDLEACGQALDVPFERAGHGLVEVVHVEDHRAIGCREAAEVGEVGVTTRLHPKS